MSSVRPRSEGQDEIWLQREDLVDVRGSAGAHPRLFATSLQADIAADLIRRGIEVHAFNRRTVAGILDMLNFRLL